MKLSLRAISALCAVTVCSNDATRASIAANRANRLSMSTDATVRPIARLHPPHTYITRPPQLVDPAIQLQSGYCADMHRSVRASKLHHGDSGDMEFQLYTRHLRVRVHR